MQIGLLQLCFRF